MLNFLFSNQYFSIKISSAQPDKKQFVELNKKNKNNNKKKLMRKNKQPSARKRKKKTRALKMSACETNQLTHYNIKIFFIRMKKKISIVTP
jgi:spore germination protein GerM